MPHCILFRFSPERDFINRDEQRSLMAVSRIITSDDVFNHILKVRGRNEDINFKRDVILEQRLQYRYNPNSRPRKINLEDRESLGKYKEYSDMIRKSMSASSYVKKHLGFNERTYSNGENGFKYFTDAIQPGGLYLLDEPENSLSAELQIDLADFILGMTRAYKCQFIISSHSPFVLSIPYAKVYDMDKSPVATCRWTELPNIRMYHDFFIDNHEFGRFRCSFDGDCRFCKIICDSAAEPAAICARINPNGIWLTTNGNGQFNDRVEVLAQCQSYSNLFSL